MEGTEDPILGYPYHAYAQSDSVIVYLHGKTWTRLGYACKSAVWWRRGLRGHWLGGSLEVHPHCCQRENKSSKAIWQILVSRWRPLAVCQARSRTGPFWDMGTGYTADPLSMPPNSSCEGEESPEWSLDSGELDPSEGPKQARRSPMQSIGRDLADTLVGRIQKRYAVQLFEQQHRTVMTQANDLTVPAPALSPHKRWALTFVCLLEAT